MAKVFLISICLVLSLLATLVEGHTSFISKAEKPHFTTRRHYHPANFTKDEIDHLLNIEYIIDGDKKAFGEVNDVIDLKSTVIFTRNGKVKREEGKELHIVVGESNVYYCFNILAPFLSAGMKLKISCPNRVPTKSIVGSIPYKTIDFEIEVHMIHKAWKRQEIIDTFNVKFITEGDSKHFARVGDMITFEYQEFNKKTGEKVWDWYRTKKEWLNKPDYSHAFVLGVHHVEHCVEIVLPVAHYDQQIEFECPVKYRERGLDRGNSIIDFHFDTIIKGHIKAIEKSYRNHDEL